MENLKVTLPEVMYSECFSRDTESFSAQQRVRVRVIFFVWKPTKLLARMLLIKNSVYCQILINVQFSAPYCLTYDRNEFPALS